MQIDPDGTRTTFATIDPAHLTGSCPGGVGLTTALTVLPGGWVAVGSLPTADGSAATAQAGCPLVLDRFGTVSETIAGDGVNGPWDMTAVSRGRHSELFVTNVLNGTVAANGAEVGPASSVPCCATALTAWLRSGLDPWRGAGWRGAVGMGVMSGRMAEPGPGGVSCCAAASTA